MPPVRAAIIDLGSNTVKVLLAEQRGTTLHVLHERAHPTRLGDGLVRTGRLSPAAIRATLDVVRNARELATAHGIGRIHAVGTSALRSASNARDFLTPARTLLGHPIRVISGAAEGRYAYAGISSSPAWHKRRVLALDLGGGSLEFVVGQNGRMEKGKSLPIGCVRLRDRFLPRQPVPVSALEEASAWIEHAVRRVLPWACEPRTTLVGCGGTMITLAALHHHRDRRPDPAALEGRMVPASALAGMLADLAARTLSGIRALPAVPPGRAEVITAGALVFHTLLRASGAKHIGCATLGLRYGLWQLEIAPRPFRRIVHESAAA